MNEQLKDAVITIAGYEDLMPKEINGVLWIGHPYLPMFSDKQEVHFEHPNYHTSADAILPVWRKVGEQIDDSDELTKKDQYHTGFGVESRHNDVGKTILNGNYESACIELANIINQIKEKV